MESHAAEARRKPPQVVYGFSPSWLDVVAQWVRRLPIPAWAFWVAFWVALMLEAAKWRDGSLPLGTIHPLHAVFNAVTVFMLAVCAFLDKVARRTLERTRPTLEVTDAEYERSEYSLTVTPAGPMLVANIIGLLVFGAGFAAFMDPVAFEQTMFNPRSVVDLVAVGANGIALSAFLYHTVHQLREVRAVIASHLKVNLDEVEPLRAFSGLTALTAGALIVANYTMLGALVAASPIIALSPLPLAITTTTSLMALIGFVWPVLDLGARMRAEKQRILSENADELRACFTERRRLTEVGQLERVASLKDAVDVRHRAWPCGEVAHAPLETFDCEGNVDDARAAGHSDDRAARPRRSLWLTTAGGVNRGSPGSKVRQRRAGGSTGGRRRRAIPGSRCDRKR